MNINKHNYESVFLDYYEGNLSDADVAELLVFLEENYNLKEIFESYENILLDNKSLTFPEKEILKKKHSASGIESLLASEITNRTSEEFFVAHIEGILSAEQEQRLNVFIEKNPQFKKEFDLFIKCKLTPEKISFPEKSFLKHKRKEPVIVSLYNYYAAAAAVILFLIGLFFFLSNNDTPKTIIANNTNKATTNLSSTNTYKKETTNSEIKNNSSLKVIKASSRHYRNTTKNVVKQNTNEPIISEDNSDESLISQQREYEKQTMQEPMEKQQDNNVVASANNIATPYTKIKINEDEYQTFSTFVTQKIRFLLGIKTTNICDNSDKLGWWDLGMAVKNEVQKIIGTKAVDINKSCEGTGEKVEYVFVVGNFEISKSVAK
ncbi:MAG: hypothetical protein V1781_00500 [Bacteroidota bacterium]